MTTLTMTLLPRHLLAPGWKAGDPIPSGYIPESWHCVDCGVNTAPGCSTRGEVELAYATAIMRGEKCRDTVTFDSHTEIYSVRDKIWEKSGMGPWGGCLCVGCLEKRLGRRLRPKDFEPGHPFNTIPGTPRLMERRGSWQPPAGQWVDWAAGPDNWHLVGEAAQRIVGRLRPTD
jgi:hypothetical protein